MQHDTHKVSFKLVIRKKLKKLLFQQQQNLEFILTNLSGEVHNVVLSVLVPTCDAAD
jgi:hypothetical protein